MAGIRAAVDNIGVPDREFERVDPATWYAPSLECSSWGSHQKNQSRAKAARSPQGDGFLSSASRRGRGHQCPQYRRICFSQEMLHLGKHPIEVELVLLHQVAIG